MFRRNEFIKAKKLIAFILALAVTFMGSLCTLYAKTGDKTTIRAGMISSLIDFIKEANNKASKNTAAPEATSIPGITPSPGNPASPESTASPDDSTDSDTGADAIYIDVYFHREGEIRTMELDDYIKGVLYGEMPAYYHAEALKAQTVAARSYTLYRIKNSITHENGADICTDYTHCQAWTAAEDGEYPDSIVSAVEDTSNIIATFDGECINALYFANSGGYTESVENVWGGAPFPYLVSVESTGEANNYDYCSVKSYTAEEFAAAIQNYSEDLTVSTEDALWSITDIQRSPTGRIISANICGKTFSGQQIRAMFNTLSSNIHFEQLSNGTMVIVAIGYGHGVGMSQYGAQAMANQGSDFEAILKHYYTGIELTKL